jgi:hypothetical protein
MLAKIMVLVGVLKRPWWMDRRLSMTTKTEITMKRAWEYGRALQEGQGKDPH